MAIATHSESRGARSLGVQMKQAGARALAQAPYIARRSAFNTTGRGWFRYLERLPELYPDHEYSLDPYLKMNCIFVHIPKCAGVSVTKILFGNLGAGHEPVKHYLFYLGAKRFDEMFKFTIMREPAERISSAFHFLKKGGFNDADKKWAEQWIKPECSVDEFIQEVLVQEEARSWIHFRPQTYFLIDPRTGAVGVDFISRLERLDEDFIKIAKKLGVSKELPKLNASPNSTSNHRGMSKASRQLVEDLYEDDFHLFERAA